MSARVDASNELRFAVNLVDLTSNFYFQLQLNLLLWLLERWSDPNQRVAR